MGWQHASTPSTNINCHAAGLKSHSKSSADGRYSASGAATAHSATLAPSRSHGLLRASGMTSGTASAKNAYMGRTEERYGGGRKSKTTAMAVNGVASKPSGSGVARPGALTENGRRTDRGSNVLPAETRHAR